MPCVCERSRFFLQDIFPDDLEVVFRAEKVHSELGDLFSEERAAQEDR